MRSTITETSHGVQMIFVYLALLTFAETSIAQRIDDLDLVEVTFSELVDKNGVPSNKRSGYLTEQTLDLIPIEDKRAVDYVCLIKMSKAAVEGSWYTDLVALPEVQRIRFEVIYGGFVESELPNHLVPKVSLEGDTLVLRGHYERGSEQSPESCFPGVILDHSLDPERFDTKKVFEGEGSRVLRDLTIVSITEGLRAEALSALQGIESSLSKQSEKVSKKVEADPGNPIDKFYDQAD